MNRSHRAILPLLISAVSCVRGAQAQNVVMNLPQGGDIPSAVDIIGAQGGGTLNLAAGTYVLYRPVNMVSNITIVGQGSSTVVTRPNGPLGWSLFANSVDSISNVTFKNFIIDGNIPPGAFSSSGSAYTGAGIYLFSQNGHIIQVSISGMEIRNTGIGLLLGNNTLVNIDHTYVHDNNPGNFAHNAYLVACSGVTITHSRFIHAHTGDGLHFDFGGIDYTISKSEFSGNNGIGILSQNNSNVTIQDSILDFNQNDGIQIDANNLVIQRDRASYNWGYGFDVVGGSGSSFGLYGFGDRGGIGYFVQTGSQPFGNLTDSTTPNLYEAEEADGVIGANDTADWTTAYAGFSGVGAVDFNASHLSDGLLTFPQVGVVTTGMYTTTFRYSNGTTGNLYMPYTVNGYAAGTITFPATGSWSTWARVNVPMYLQSGNNVVQVSPQTAGAPELDYLQVNTSVPAAPAAPTGVTATPVSPYRVNLSWNAVPGASSYTIVRNGFIAAVNVYPTNWTDNTFLLGNSSASYTVYSVNQGGSTASSSVSATTPVDAPVGLQIDGTALTWFAANGATSYNVKRSTVTGGPYVTIANVTSASYTDSSAAAGTYYFYVVSSVGPAESVNSYEVTTFPTSRDAFTILTASPSALTLAQGATGSSAISIALGFGYAGPVTLSTGALPPGLTASLTALTSTSYKLSVVASATAAPGAYTFALTGLSSSGNATIGITVFVTPTISTQTITFGAIPAQTVGTTLGLTATASSGLPVSYSSSTLAICTVSGSTATLVAPGTCTITASQPGNASSGPATPVTQSFTVISTQTITFAAIPTQTAGRTLALTATASSGLAVTYNSSTPAVCTVSGSTATLLAPGTCTITASQPGNAAWAPATPVSESFTVNAAYSLTPASSTLMLAPNQGGTDTISYAAASGFSGGTFSVSGLPAGVSAAFTQTYATSTLLVVFAPASTVAGTYPLSVTAKAGASTATTTVTLVIKSAYTLSPASSTLTLTPNQGGTDTISYAAASGFSGAAFSVTGLPKGVSAAFTQTYATSTLLVVFAPSTTAGGTYPLTVTATVGGTTASTTVTLVINPAFTLNMSAPSLTLARNTGGTDVVNIVPLGGFSGSVSFSVAGLPSPASYAFVSGTTLVIFVPSSTAAGTYNLTVTGNSGTLTASTALTLIVK